MIDWYKQTKTHIYIKLSDLTNDRMSKCDIIPDKHNNKIVIIKGKNNALDINKLIMEKMIHCKYLELHTENLMISILPPNLVSYTETFHNDIVTFPDNLETYQFYADNEKNIIIIPSNLPQNLKNVILIGHSINDTMYNIPSSVTSMIINVDTFDVENIIWPLNMKTVKIRINCKYDKDLGIFPHGLETFIFTCQTYDHKLIVPPTVTKFTFYTNFNSIYKHDFSELPDNIKILSLPYIKDYEIEKIPKNCEKFTYFRSPKNILEKLQSRYPNVYIIN